MENEVNSEKVILSEKEKAILTKLCNYLGKHIHNEIVAKIYIALYGRKIGYKWKKIISVLSPFNK